MRKYYYSISPSGNRIIIFYENEMLYSFVEGNKDSFGLEYLEWVAEGNEAEPWDPENPPV